ncbi:MAG: hypothetical protein BalsKO_29130 [Balneolaceae bacterium]
MAWANNGNRINYKQEDIYKLPRNETKPHPKQINAKAHENQNGGEMDPVFLWHK